MATIEISKKEMRKLEALMRYYRSMSGRIVILNSEGLSPGEISKKLGIPVSFINAEIFKFQRNGRDSLAQIQQAL